MAGINFLEATTRQPVQVGADTTAGQSGPLPVTLGSTGTGATQVQGTAANDAPVVGNPVLVGARASANAPSAVSADGDAVDLWALLTGQLAVFLGVQLGPGDHGLRTYSDLDIQTPVITTTSSPAYSAGDCIGTPQDLAPGLDTALPVVLRNILLRDANNQRAAMWLLFFKVAAASLTGTYTDNAAMVLTAADLANLAHVHIVAAGDWQTIPVATPIHAVMDYEYANGIVIGPTAGAISFAILAVGTPTLGANSTSILPIIRFERGY